MSSPPLNKSCNRAGLFKRPVRSSASSRWPRPWSRTASNSASGASSWQPGHPVAARDSPRRMNSAVVPYATFSHRARTPGRPVGPSSATPHPAPDLTPRTSPRAEQRCFTRPSPSTSLGRGKWLRLPDQNWFCIPDRYHRWTSAAPGGSGRTERLPSLDVAYEIGPGQAGRKRLTELALGLAKVKSSGQPICSAGILLEVGLEVFDRPGEVPRHLAGAAHREEEPRAARGSWRGREPRIATGLTHHFSLGFLGFLWKI